MPKKPRKTRIGSRAWAAQKAHDIAQNQTTKEKEKEKTYGDRKRAHRDNQWHKEKEPEQKQKQKQNPEDRKSWRQPQGRYDTMRLSCLRVLGLTLDKDNEESIKREYRRLSLLFHPDRNPIVSALEKMKAINNAFEYLMGKNV